MSRPAVQRFLTWLTFALAMVLPLRAGAAILPLCEDDAMSTSPLAQAEPEPSCTVVTSVDEATGETSAAPICDPRGASAVAPPRLLAVSDARIDAAPGCDEGVSGPVVGQGSRDAIPGGELGGYALYAVLAPAPELAALWEAVLLAPTPPVLGPRAGISRRVDHPPR